MAVPSTGRRAPGALRAAPPAAALLPLLLGAVGCASSSDRDGEAPRREAAATRYPEAPRTDTADVLHGVAVPDPFRPLEDPDAPETRAWIEAQNELAFAWLAEVPERERIRARLRELEDHERCGVPIERAGRLFFRRNAGLQAQPVLLVSDASYADARELLDPNRLSDDGTVALADVVPSPDGRLVAYGLSDGGSDWRTWRVRDVRTGEDLSDVVRWNKFGGAAWAGDASGFYYTRYAPPAADDDLLRARNLPPEVWFHRIGTSQEEDELVRARPEEQDVGQWCQVTDDGRWLVVGRWRASDRRTEIDVVDLATRPEEREPRPLDAGYRARTSLVGPWGGFFYLLTDEDAPRKRIVGVEVGRPDERLEVVAEGEHAIEDVVLGGGRLVVHRLVDAASELSVYAADGELVRRVELPGLGTVRDLRAYAEHPVVRFSFADFARPATVLELDVRTGEVRPFFEPRVPFEPEDFAVEQVFYSSADGTRVPMFLVRRRGVEADGAVPTYLYGYGGFGVSVTPSFSGSSLVWMEMGGLLAVPNLRGGGEYGEEWHRAGTKLDKQNVFDDFVAAAEWLVESGWTRPERLAIAGGSNGGLLVGACMTQRPELFGAVLPAVGVLDMIRYHLFTIGWAWASDYGTADDPDEFRALLEYSPYHNVAPGRSYPATLITTADHDDRVVPAHSFKFAAALQEAQAGPAPILIRIETRAGHGAGKPTEMRIEESADRLAFLVRALGMEPWAE